MESSIKPIAYLVTKKENGKYVCGLLVHYVNQRKVIADWYKQEYDTRRECLDVLVRHSNAGNEFIPIATTHKTLRRILREKYPTVDVDFCEVYGPYFRHFDTRET